MTNEPKHTPPLCPALTRLKAHSRDYGPYDGGSQRQDDLAELYRACNSHDALVHIADIANSWLKLIERGEKPSPAAIDGLRAELAALTKAKAGQQASE